MEELPFGSCILPGTEAQLQARTFAASALVLEAIRSERVILHAELAIQRLDRLRRPKRAGSRMKAPVPSRLR